MPPARRLAGRGLSAAHLVPAVPPRLTGSSQALAASCVPRCDSVHKYQHLTLLTEGEFCTPCSPAQVRKTQRSALNLPEFSCTKPAADLACMQPHQPSRVGAQQHRCVQLAKPSLKPADWSAPYTGYSSTTGGFSFKLVGPCTAIPKGYTRVCRCGQALQAPQEHASSLR
jgi:hypothetical protein